MVQRICPMAQMTRFARRLATIVPLAALLATTGAPLVSPAPAPAGATELGRYSKLPLPRYVSLKSARANVRNGPSRDDKVNWLYLKAGLPVEIIQEYDHWRRIRDSDGTEGWVYHSLLSGSRTAWETSFTRSPCSFHRSLPSLRSRSRWLKAWSGSQALLLQGRSPSSLLPP